MISGRLPIFSKSKQVGTYKLFKDVYICYKIGFDEIFLHATRRSESFAKVSPPLCFCPALYPLRSGGCKNATVKITFFAWSEHSFLYTVKGRPFHPGAQKHCSCVIGPLGRQGMAATLRQHCLRMDRGPGTMVWAWLQGISSDIS